MAPEELEARFLTHEEFARVRETVRDVFNNALPETVDQRVLAIIEAETGEVVAFAHLETIIHLNSLYVAPKYRQRGFLSRIIHLVESLIPKGASVFVLPDKNLHSLLRRKFFFRRLSGEVWRRDF